jgi:hypothetical protein
MSHFVVLVAGEDHDALLRPFHEFECTGEDDQYVQDLDITEAFLKDMEEQNAQCVKEGEKPFTALEFLDYWHSYTTIPLGVDPKTCAEAKYGYVVVDEKDELVKVVNRTNPNAKWDWYVVGGRWSGLLPTKDGRRVDEATKGEIDLQAMLSGGIDEAMRRYDQLKPIVDEHGWITSEQAREQAGDDHEKLRDIYHGQPAKDLLLAKLTEITGDSFAAFGFNFDDLLLDREGYEKRRIQANVTFAFLDDEGWFERGEMGWFACVSDEKDKGDWFDIWMERWNRLDDDAVIRAVDCHI